MIFKYDKFVLFFNKILKNKKNDENLLVKSFFTDVNIYYKLAIISFFIKKKLNIIPYKEQILTSYNLFNNINVEMYTGEGKSISILIASLLKVSKNHKVHVMTVNDYLAYRDVNYFKDIFNVFNLEVNFIPENKFFLNVKNIYERSNIIYASINTLVFHFLFELTNKDDFIKRDVLIIDEFDQIIIDYVNRFLISDKKRFLDILNDKQKIIISKIYNFIHHFKKFIKKKYFKKGYLKINKKEKQVIISSLFKKKIFNLFKKYLYKENKNIEFSYILFLIKNFFYVYFFLQNKVHYIISKKQIKIISQHTGRIGDKTVYTDIINFVLLIKENLGLNNISISVNSNSILLNLFLTYYNSFVGTSGTMLSLKYKLSVLSDLNMLKTPRRKKYKLEKFKDIKCKNFNHKLSMLLSLVIQKYKTSQPIIVIAQNLLDCEKIYNFLIKRVNPLFYNIYKLTPDNLFEEQKILDKVGDFGNILVTTNICSRGTDIKLGGELLNKTILKLKSSTKLTQNKKLQLQILQTQYEKLIEVKGIFMIIFEHSNLLRTDKQIEGRVARKGEPGSLVYLLSQYDKIFEDSINPFLKTLALEERVNIIQRNYENVHFSSNFYNMFFDYIFNFVRKFLIKFKKFLFHSSDDNILLFVFKYIIKYIYIFFKKKNIKFQKYFISKKKFLKYCKNININNKDMKILKNILWYSVVNAFYESNKFNENQIELVFFFNFFSNKNMFMYYKIKLLKFFFKEIRKNIFLHIEYLFEILKLIEKKE